MSKGRAYFIERNLEELISGDDDIRNYFQDVNGNRLDSDDPLYREQVGKLEASLGRVYDLILVGRKKGEGALAKYVAPVLRGIAAGAYAAAPALFFLAPGPAGFGASGVGVGASTLADVVENYSRKREGNVNWKDTGKVWAENAVTKPLAYLPIGTGLIDLYRGKRKFENKAEKHLEEYRIKALDYAKRDFLSRQGAEELESRGKIIPLHTEGLDRKIIPLHRLRDPAYAKAA